MPQIQLPIFPKGSQAITAEIGFTCEDGRVTYWNGHLPVFVHGQEDVQSFRLFTSQLIINGTVRQVDVARAFGVPLRTVKRYVKLYREEGARGFFKAPRRRSGSVLTGEVKDKAQQLLDEGKSVPEVGRELTIRPNTLHKAIDVGRLRQSVKKNSRERAVASSKSERSASDSQAGMGYGATRTLSRVAAAVGQLQQAPIEFETVDDLPQGGVLLAVPALLANGLLRHSQELYALPAGFYGLETMFLVVALLALGRVKSLEKVRYEPPGEWGKLVGLDRIPEVRTLRAKLKSLSREPGRAAQWGIRLAQDWMRADPESAGLFYADGHVRVYHGHLTPLPRHYVARERLCLRGTTDYWINALDGQPFFLVTREVDPGLLAVLREDLVPRLEELIGPAPAGREEVVPFVPRFTLVFDREAYSPTFFQEMKERHIAILTYHKYPGKAWPEAEFQEQEVELSGGERVKMKLTERLTRLSNKLEVREIRKLSDKGHQTSILSTDYRSGSSRLAASMFARWCQENFYKYMREHYNLDHLVEYGTEPIPGTTRVVNPRWRELDSKIRSLNGQRQRQLALFGALQLEEGLEEPQAERYQREKGELQETVAQLDQQMGELKSVRQDTPQHVTIEQLSEKDRFERLRTERKHFLDTIKLIAYRAETNMAQIVREKLSRQHDARALLRQVYGTEVDLRPDPEARTLTVRLHHLTQAAHDIAIRHLCEELNQTETLFPGTNLRLVYQLGTC